MRRPGPQATRLPQGTHRWCACARPEGLCPVNRVCDGVPFTLDRDRTLGLCRCGRTRTPPECDGSHAAGRPGLLTRLIDRLRR